MKTYDYADETKDVKGKVINLIVRVNESMQSLNFNLYFKNRRVSCNSSFQI